MSCRDLKIRTVAGSAGLRCDWSFSLPSVEDIGAHLLVLTVQDTIPVMLGYCLPHPGNRKQNGVGPLGPDEDLQEVVGSPDSEVRVSPASTALALIMMNPLMAGATDEGRFWFAAQVVASEGYQELVDEISGALEASPKSYLDGQTCPGIYLRVSGIISGIVGRSGKGDDPGGGGPYVADAVGDEITLGNAGFIHYGVGISDAVADTAMAVLLLPKREMTSLVNPGPPVRNLHCIGDGCFDIAFFKGLSGFDSGPMLEPGHPGGLATRANSAQAIWNAVTIFAALPDLENPVEAVIGGAECVERFAGAIESGDSAGIILVATDCCSRFPGQVTAWLWGERISPLSFTGFVSSVRNVLSNCVRSFVTVGLLEEDRFSCQLVGAVAYQSQCICQRDGEMTSCPEKPMLSEGAVSPSTGGPGTEFRFTVRYRDDLEDPPAYVEVIVDGDARDMTLLSGTAADGVYGHATSLSPGMHTYSFTCADTSGALARFPSSGPLEGPFVATAPVLKRGGVDPARGNPTTEFRYSVDYHDDDGQRPASIHVFIDGNPYAMGLRYWFGDYGNYRYTTKLPEGQHTCYFLAVDPSDSVARRPAAGVFSAPYVRPIPELSEPLLKPLTGMPGTEFKYEVHYFDPDGDPPLFVRVYVDEIGHPMILKSGTASDGTYCYGKELSRVGYYSYYFMCADSTDVTVRLPEAGKFSGPYVKPPGERNPWAKVAVHVRAHSSKMNCSRDFPEITNVCRDVEATYPGYDVDCFPVFYGLSEYRGVDFGLCWPDWMHSASWHSCADMAAGDIRRPGDGVSLVWYECSYDAVLVPGWAWIYADYPGEIHVCPYNLFNRIRVVDCYGGTTEPQVYGYAGVYGAEGADPCAP